MNQPTCIGLEITRKPIQRVKPLKIAHDRISMRFFEIPLHFIQERKTKGYDVNGIKIFRGKVMRFIFKKRSNRSLLYY